MGKLTLKLLKQDLMICKLNSNAAVPTWAVDGELLSITRTTDELSIVCRDQDAPETITCEHKWKGLRAKGVLDFSLTGILTSLTKPLADANISVFAISTYNTDYLLVKEKDLPPAIKVLMQEGYTIE